MKRVDSKLLVNYILATIGPCDHLKLQKLLYYVEAWHLVFFEESIVEDEFEAWVHGPVSRKIWNYVKDHSQLYRIVKLKPELEKDAIAKVQEILDPNQLELIADVLKEYASRSSYHLENLSHQEAPWMEARRGLAPDESSNRPISKESMKTYYRSLLKTDV